MSQSDWGNLSGGLSESDVLRGPTAGTPAPNGGGSHVFGFKSASDTKGAAGKYCLLPNFTPPTPSMRGGRISGAIKRGSIGASSGFAPFLFFSSQGATIGSSAYLLGLSDEAASHIELRKGQIVDGLPAAPLVQPAVSPNILMRSTDTFAADTWQHLRLDVIVQGTGDVILQVYRNDLNAHSVSAPVWAAVPGMEGPYTAFSGFVDDALGIATGSAPHTSGGMGFAARFEAANRAAFFDHISIDRQL